MKTRKNALITGASVGIGYELTRVFAREGWGVALVARNEERLQKIAELLKGRVIVLPEDLSDPAAPQRIHNKLREQDFEVDALVNNAGFGTYGPFVQTPVEKEMQEIQVNVAALTHLTKLFLPAMLANKSGRILNVASVAAFPPGPLMAVYYATKAYVLSFSEAISEELRGSGVTVTALCPGPTSTEFGTRAGVSESILFQGRSMSAQDVAEQGYAAMMRGKRVVIPGFTNRLLATAATHWPRWMSARVVHKLQSTRSK